jgi:hypothetical protein
VSTDDLAPTIVSRPTPIAYWNRDHAGRNGKRYSVRRIRNGELKISVDEMFATDVTIPAELVAWFARAVAAAAEWDD